MFINLDQPLPHCLEGAFRWRQKLCKPNQNWKEFKSLHPSEQSTNLFCQHCQPVTYLSKIIRYLLAQHESFCQEPAYKPPVLDRWAPATGCRDVLPAQDSLVQVRSWLTHTRSSEPGQCTGVMASFTKSLVEDQVLGSSCDKSWQSCKLKSWVLFPSQPADEVRGKNFPNPFTDYCLNNWAVG